MQIHNETGLIPVQYTGDEILAEAYTILRSEAEAMSFYEVAKQRLLNVDQWHKLAGFVSAEFQVFNANGQEALKAVEKGDFIRVDIPGPGSVEGDGYDWVMVEELKEVGQQHLQSIGFRVRPTAMPGTDKEAVAHFYDREATSTFIITREDNKVSATVLDRNIKPNTNNDSIVDRIRDTTVALGAMAAFSKAQWQNLANGLVLNKQ